MPFGADGGTIGNTGQVAASGVVAVLLGANSTQSRVSLSITNTSPAGTPVLMYVGTSNAVTTSTGHLIPANTTWVTTYRGPLWVIAASAVTATYFEEVNA
jgi:hypothetical protein